MDHVVEVRDLAIGIRDHREVDGLALCLGDVLLPFEVGGDRVDREADDLDAALVELRLQLGDGAELGGAHRREVLRMGEEHCPAVALPIEEVDRALRGLCGEVGSIVPESNGHGGLLVCLSDVFESELLTTLVGINRGARPRPTSRRVTNDTLAIASKRIDRVSAAS